MVLIIKETKEEMQFNDDFDYLFNQMYANLPLTPPITREQFLNFKRKLRNEVIKKWKPKIRRRFQESSFGGLEQKMTTKYYLRIPCDNLSKFPNWHSHKKDFYGCPICHKQGFTRGADVTELINYIKILEPKLIPNLITHNLIEVMEE